MPWFALMAGVAPVVTVRRMRTPTPLLSFGISLVALTGTAHAASDAYEVRLTGVQNVRLQGTGLLPAGPGCSYSRTERARARYVFKTGKILARVADGAPTAAELTRRLRTEISGTLILRTQGTALCAPPAPVVSIRCRPRRAPLGAACAELAEHAPFEAPDLALGSELREIFRHRRGAIAGSASSLDYVDVFDRTVHADPCASCVERRIGTTWRLSVKRRGLG